VDSRIHHLRLDAIIEWKKAFTVVRDAQIGTTLSDFPRRRSSNNLRGGVVGGGVGVGVGESSANERAPANDRYRI